MTLLRAAPDPLRFRLPASFWNDWRSFPSRLRLDVWKDYFDKCAIPNAPFLLNILTYGFRLPDDHVFDPAGCVADFDPTTARRPPLRGQPRRPRQFPNHGSATRHRDAVAAELTRISTGNDYRDFPRIVSLALGRDDPFLRRLHISPMGTVPKGNGKLRITLDLSFPRDDSNPNAWLGKPPSFNMMRIDDFVRRLKRGDYIYRIDARDAFLQIPLSPESWPFTAVSLDEFVHFYAYTPFGLRFSSYAFDLFGDAITTFAAVVLRIILDRYCDDWMGVASSLEKAMEDIKRFVDLLIELGLLDSSEKLVGPAQVIVVLGFVVDTLKEELRLPADKLDRLLNEIRCWLSRRTASFDELEHLVGVLQWAAPIARGGRFFLRRLYDAKKRIADRDHRRRFPLPAGAIEDIKWWFDFLTSPDWVGHSTFIRGKATALDLQFSTDASSTGYGAFWEGHWFYGKFEGDFWTRRTIFVKEAWVVLLAAHKWGHLWRGRYVCARVDNIAVVGAINKAASKDPFVMEILRALYRISSRDQYDLCSEHIPGATNHMPDALSRGKMDTFWAYAHEWDRDHPSAPVQPAAD